MNHILIRSFLLLSLSVPVLEAQSAGAAAGKKPQETTKPREATAGKIDSILQLDFGVTGLTAENAAKVKESLAAMTTQTFTCESCDVEQALAGKCPKCSAPLDAETRGLFLSATPTPAETTIRLAFSMTTAVRLADIQGVLTRTAVEIDPARFPIVGRAQLVIHGASAEQAAAVTKVLQDSKLFDDVSPVHDTTTKDLVVLIKGSKATTMAAVNHALAGSKATIADIRWNAGMPRKST